MERSREWSTGSAARRKGIVLSLLVFGVIAPVLVSGQTAQGVFMVSGTVLDEQARPIVGLTVILSESNGTSKHESRSDSAGRFELKQLSAGKYVLQIEQPGFRSFRGDIVVVDTNVQRDVTLRLGSLTEVVTIYGAGPRRKPRVARSHPERVQRIVRKCLESLPRSQTVGGNIRPPRKRRDQRPAYPDHLSNAGKGGIVELQGRLATDGRVLDILIIRPSAHRELADSAVEAISAWEFEPTLLNCEPVDVGIFARFEFTPL